jgi:predicted transposase YdaD
LAQPHDSGYKLLFSHPALVADLLRGFVAGDWVAELDFTTLEKQSGSYVSDDLRPRADDVVWRVRWRDRWLYVYLLLEFQSAVDPFMAVRLLAYVGLLYQDLIRARQFASEGHLPPVLPVVLYNGRLRWTAATEVADLLVPPPAGLAGYQPRLRYLLLEENRFAAGELAPMRNLVAALFQLENSRGPEELQQVVERLVEWLQAPEQASLRRAFAVWLRDVLLPARLPGVRIDAVLELSEVQNMLAERVLEWTQEWKQQGLDEGRQEGLKAGESLMLQRLLTLKFGPLDAATRARLAAADSETLLVWGERVLAAGSLAEVFAGTTGP